MAAVCDTLKARLTLSDEELGVVVEQLPPSFLGCSLEGRLEPTLAFLARYVGEERVTEFVRMHPRSLLWRDEGMSPVAQHLRLVGLPESAVTRAIRGFPAISRLASAANLDALLTYLQEELDLSLAVLGRMIAVHPQLLGLSPATNVAPTVAYLGGLGVNCSRVVARHPQLLGLSVQANLRPTVQYLQRLGVDATRAIDTHPQMLGLSVQGKLRPTVSFLRAAGVRRVGMVLTAQPALLSLSVEANLRPKVEFLHELRMEDVGAQLEAYPAILTLSLERNLRPTAAALAAAGLLADPSKLRPRHLAASLEARVLPRLAFSSKHGRTPSLGAVSSSSDAAFCKHVGQPAGSYQAFLSAWRAERQGGDDTLSIPWLPEGMDLSALLLGAELAKQE